MITHKTKFLSLVNEGKIEPSLKSFSDTLLFYYFGHLSLVHGPGKVLEIGIGGSSFVLSELAHNHAQELHLVDGDQFRVDLLLANSNWKFQNFFTHIIDSQDLPSRPQLNPLSYCHIDGSKTFKATKSDLEYCLKNLSPNGLICQDDFGNNKWPTVVDVVKQLEFEGQLKIVAVGDSSAWVTRTEYYDHWMQLLKNDYEFQLLSKLLHCVNSHTLDTKSDYYFLNQVCMPNAVCNDTNEHDYYQQLLNHNHGYLIMPYVSQSTPGVKLGLKKLYKLTYAWAGFRGDHWPQQPPTHKEDIDQLPDYIKKELQELFNFGDLYQTL